MKTLMILAHPDLESSIANKYISESIKAKVENIEIRDIFSLYPDFKIDVEAEQKALIEADTVIFQYPFFWYNMPAILKQWFDKVFDFNFAYGPEGDKLKGKNFQLSFTIGGPKDSYTPVGYNHFRIEDLTKPMEQTAYLSQMNFLKPIYQHEMVFIPGVYNTKEAVLKNAENQIERIYKLIKELENNNPENKIENFVKNWFKAMEEWSENGYFKKFIANDAKLVFPDAEYIGHDGFNEWYSDIKSKIKSSNHIIDNLSINKENGFYKVDFDLKLEAISTKEENIELAVKENWKLEITKDERIKIHEYLVESVN